MGTGSILSDWAGVVEPGRYWLERFVDYPRPGYEIYSRMLGLLESSVNAAAHELAVCVREDRTETVAFPRAAGFEEQFRSWGASTAAGA